MSYCTQSVYAKALQGIVLASEAWQSSGDGGTGLPRFARNDGIGGAPFLLNHDTDIDYIEQHIRYESAGDYGVADLKD